MEHRRLTEGRDHARRFSKRVFPQSARTWILSIIGACLVAFVIIPVGVSRLSGANAVAVSANALTEDEPSATPIPFDSSVFSAMTEPATPQPSAEPTPGVHVSQYTLLQENDDYPTVEKLQLRLMELGYLDSDEPSTVYNSATTVAVSLFQRTLDYDMDGIADSELQESLFSDDATPYEIKLGDSGSDVESMQSRLNELGYYDGKINGYFGVATEDALEAFQTKNKIDVDSIFNVADRDLLFSPDARPKIDPTPTPSPTPKPTKKPTTTTSSSSSSSSTTTTATATPTPSTSSDSSDDSDTSTGGSYNAPTARTDWFRSRRRCSASSTPGPRKARPRASIVRASSISACAPAASAPADTVRPASPP